MFVRLAALLLIVSSIVSSFAMTQPVSAAESIPLLEQMHEENMDVYLEAWAPHINQGTLDQDGVWFATLTWIGIAPDKMCDVLSIPQGINYIIWNGVVKGDDGAYQIDTNATPIIGTADKDITIRSCRAYFTREALPTDTRKFLAGTNSITPDTILTMCGQTCSTMDIDPVINWVVRVIPQADSPENCPSWTLDATTTAVFAGKQGDQLFWQILTNTTIDHPVQPFGCAAIWFFRNQATGQVI